MLDHGQYTRYYIVKVLFANTCFIYEYSQGKETFGWSDEDTKQLFNLHPVLMIFGFVFFMGQCER